MDCVVFARCRFPSVLFPVIVGQVILEWGPLHARQECRNLQSGLGQPRSELKLLHTSVWPTLTLGLPIESVVGAAGPPLLEKLLQPGK